MATQEEIRNAYKRLIFLNHPDKGGDGETDGTSDGQKHIVVVNSEGERIDVGQERWDTWKYEIDSTDNQIKPILDGVFVQYPLKTAWAVTIHKAQGLTFDRLQVDAAAAFTYGQVYVALSRCRSLEGLTLLSPITPQNAFENKDIEQFNSTMTPSVQVEQMLEGFRTQYYFDVLFELFDFSGFQHAVERVYRLYQDSLYRIYPDQTAELAQLCGNEVNGLMTVAERFRRQLAGIGMNPDSRSLLEERIGKAVVYFGKTLKSMDEKVSPLLTVEIDNKETVKHLKDIADGYRNVVGLKMALLSHVEHDGFSIEKYQKAKVDFTLQKPEKERRRKEQVVSESVQNPKLAAMLSAWRKGKADEMNVPAFAIMHQKTLFAIVNALPTTKAELLKVPGIGKGKVDKFGDEIVQMVRDYCTDNGIEVAPTLDEPLSTAEKSSSASKPEKTAMWRRTAELLAEGMSVASIAEELHRAVSTIEGYVFLAVENGVLDPDLVVSQEAQDEIIAFLLDNRDMTHLKEVYEHFEGRYSYLQLRVARHLAAEL